MDGIGQLLEGPFRDLLRQVHTGLEAIDPLTAVVGIQQISQRHHIGLDSGIQSDGVVARPGPHQEGASCLVGALQFQAAEIS